MQKLLGVWTFSHADNVILRVVSAHHREGKKQNGPVRSPASEPLCMCNAGTSERKGVGQGTACIEWQVELQCSDQDEGSTHWPSQLSLDCLPKVEQSCDH